MSLEPSITELRRHMGYAIDRHRRLVVVAVLMNMVFMLCYVALADYSSQIDALGVGLAASLFGVFVIALAAFVFAPPARLYALMLVWSIATVIIFALYLLQTFQGPALSRMLAGSMPYGIIGVPMLTLLVHAFVPHRVAVRLLWAFSLLLILGAGVLLRGVEIQGDQWAGPAWILTTATLLVAHMSIMSRLNIAHARTQVTQQLLRLQALQVRDTQLQVAREQDDLTRGLNRAGVQRQLTEGVSAGAVGVVAGLKLLFPAGDSQLGTLTGQHAVLGATGVQLTRLFGKGCIWGRVDDDQFVIWVPGWSRGRLEAAVRAFCTERGEVLPVISVIREVGGEPAAEVVNLALAEIDNALFIQGMAKSNPSPHQ